ncbi:SusD/RagB family nutrient-binding outer membrane lipoprotein [Rhodohalobacter sp. 8-1]|uniref:SusD/RagB family nutrient-binding outer membrane lipoprotein n=1 Tax=Rhodohalobacter sp. 8-1 TaxID=3131972 RepID=UPI0030EDF4DD
MLNFRKYIFIVLLIAGMVGCDTVNTSFTDGYSEDPNNPTDAPGDQVFAAGQIATITFLESHTARLTSMWSQYFTGSDRQYTALYNYTIQGGTEFDSNWFLAYTRALTNLQIAREKYNEREIIPEVNVAATKVLEALVMGQVASLWGDVPYREANQPDEFSEPSYDPQSQVYSDIDQLLNEAISTFESTTAAVSNDITSLEGSNDGWLKVAYTLKARYLMHVGDYPAAATAAANGIDAADGSGDLLAVHGVETNRNMNLYHNFAVQQRSGYLRAGDSHSAVLLENGDNAKTTEADRYSYYYNGTGGDRDLNLDDGFAAADASFPLVTYLENQLIIAEVEARNGTTAGNNNAITALNNTRDYLNNQFGAGNYSDLALLDFQTGGIYDGTSILQHVYNWTYLGYIGQIEGYNFLRRIDFDVDGLSPVTGSEFPLRFIYPQTERNTNPNVPSPAPGSFDATPVNQ